MSLGSAQAIRAAWTAVMASILAPGTSAYLVPALPLVTTNNRFKIIF
jgi:hypothetical protein